MILVCVIGIAVALLAIQFKSIKPEYGIYISIVGCILIFMSSISYINELLDAIKTFKSLTSISNDYINILIKIVGITFVSEISSDIVNDCGYKSVSNHIQIFGKLTVLLISLPIFIKLISSIGNLLL